MKRIMLTRQSIVSLLGQEVTVVIDRPLGSRHPKHNDMVYPVNYGYVPHVWAADGEEQDAYVLGVHEPLKEFNGTVIAIVWRQNDNEDKLVVAPKDMTFDKEEIREQVRFQEQYFDSQIIIG